MVVLVVLELMDLWSPAGVGDDFSLLGGTGVGGAFSS